MSRLLRLRGRWLRPGRPRFRQLLFHGLRRCHRRSQRGWTGRWRRRVRQRGHRATGPRASRVVGRRQVDVPRPLPGLLGLLGPLPTVVGPARLPALARMLCGPAPRLPKGAVSWPGVAVAILPRAVVVVPAATAPAALMVSPPVPRAVRVAATLSAAVLAAVSAAALGLAFTLSSTGPLTIPAGVAPALASAPPVSMGMMTGAGSSAGAGLGLLPGPGTLLTTSVSRPEHVEPVAWPGFYFRPSLQANDGFVGRGAGWQWPAIRAGDHFQLRALVEVVEHLTL